MKWEIEYTDEFGKWWETLTEEEQDSIAVSIGLLERLGPNLPRPHSDTVKGSKFVGFVKSPETNVPSFVSTRFHAEQFLGSKVFTMLSSFPT